MSADNSRHDDDIARTLGLGTAAARKRYWKRWLGWTALALVVLAGWMWWESRGSDSQVRYRTQPAKRGDITVTVTATGTLQPINQVDVGSELSGIIKSVEVDYNHKVTVGQVLARLDTTKLEAQREQLRAAVQAAQAKVWQTQATIAEARAQLARLRHVQQLSGGKVPSQQDIDSAEAAEKRARADEANAKAAVSQARASLNAAETDLSKTVIRAPINGVVLKRTVERGQTVAASLQAPVLFTLAEDLTKMQLHVNVDEADIGKVAEGQRATFTVDAYPDRTFPARISEVRYGSQTVQGVVTYEALLDADNADLSLRPGMTGTADITVRKIDNVLMVPNAALRFAPPAAQDQAVQDRGSLLSKLMPRPPRSRGKTGEDTTAAGKGQRVWVLRDGQPAAMAVKIGATDGAMTEIISGEIEPGSQIIVDTITSANKK